MIVAVRGVRYRVAVDGRGPAVVLLHGFTGSLATWDAVVAALVPSFTAVRLDLLGHGGSDAPDDPARYSMEEAVADIGALADRLGLGRFHLVGYSFGGRVALHVALAMPERLRSLVLEGASPGIPSEPERAARRAADAELADFIEREGTAAFVARWEQLPLFATERALPDAVREAIRAERLAQRPRGLANSLRGAGAGSQAFLLPLLPSLTVPALLVAGALDAKYSEWARTMAAALPNARAAIVPEAGHAVHRERPEAFVQLLVEHLKTVEGEADEHHCLEADPPV